MSQKTALPVAHAVGQNQQTDHAVDSIQNQRSYLIFTAGIRANATLITYTKYLEVFRKFAKSPDYDSLINMPEKNRRILIEDFVLLQRKYHRYASLDTILSSVTKFFTMNDIMVNSKKLRSFFPAKLKPLGDKAYTTEDVQYLLSLTKTLKHKALIHILASSGMRAGAICNMKLKHLKDMPQNCKSVLVYPRSLEEYTTFISPEAVNHLEKYFDERKNHGEKLTDESFLFMTDGTNARQFSETWVSALMGRMAQKLPTRNRANDMVYDKKATHALRKRFNTIVKMSKGCNLSLAERLMGHSQSVKLDNSYFKPTIEQLFSEYLNALPEIMVDEKYKLRIELKKQQEKINELESSENKIKMLEEKLNQVLAHTENII